MAKCKSCGADIIWIKTKNGRSMPCDSKPIPFRESFSGGMKLVTKAGDVVPGNYDRLSEVRRSAEGQEHEEICTCIQSGNDIRVMRVQPENIGGREVCGHQ